MNIITPIGSREWFYCEGSQLMQEGEPDNSDRTRDNIACHWLINQVLETYVKPSTELKSVEDFKDTLSPNEVLIDDEMCEAAKVFITNVLMFCNHTGLMSSVKVNVGICLDNIYPGMTGTVDAWVFNPKTRELVIWLMKYEHGYVDVIENPEMMLYAAGIMNEGGLKEVSDQAITVTFQLIQPRSYRHGGTVINWSVNGAELRGNINKLKYAANIAMQGTGQCTPGLHCHYCKGRHKCQALMKTCYIMFDVIDGPSPVEISGSNLSVELKIHRYMSSLMKYRLSGLEAQAERELKQGGVLPGFKLEQGYGRKRWIKTMDSSEVLLMGDLQGVDLRKPDNLVTPTQAINMFKKQYKSQSIEYDPKIIEQYIETPKTSLNLVEDDGKLAQQVFKK